MAFVKSVLVIDDDPAFVATVASVLGSIGVRKLLAAEDGETGVEIVSGTAEDQQIDLILVDFETAGIESIVFLREISRAGYRGSVVITGGEPAEINQSAWKICQCFGLDGLTTIRKPHLIEEYSTILGQVAQAA